ncbi:pur operon repressor [Paenactinomyces guangxiensis]|uniref:Pur operon repressor n=1 Tax=Paenactinomyces guangxiensis TaxID=1490290 RepID=A0A7W1WTL1_9BACL|nr:pur operon repressor [Paenactinomyces guangxiensis]MBA4495825.1 pur operon repressor [Paenactinomyces guangxiensis]MBH8592915.1 pur operon repressor [Paenactinomyces guangxiensis]
MDKWKRSARLVDMTRQLLAQPYRLIPLTTFAERYKSAKSSISEDLAIIHEVFSNEGSGELETVAGAAGGVRYIPRMNQERAREVLRALTEQLANPDRILPGGFLYLSDLLGDTVLLSDIGRIFATVFAGEQIDAIMTVETKGIPLAHAVASYLRAPVVIARYDYRVTEGSVVTVNTVSGSSRRMRQLSLSKRSLAEGSRVLIIDDFMKAGGTVQGMIDLLNEFQAEVVGVGVMVESPAEEKLVDSYVSLATITQVDIKQRKIQVELGNLFTQKGEWKHEKS